MTDFSYLSKHFVEPPKNIYIHVADESQGVIPVKKNAI